MLRYDDLEELVLEKIPTANISFLRKAEVFAAKAHKGQLRASGEPYLYHPISVAYILAEWESDLTTIVSGLLHDVMEDADVPKEELKKLFGKEVAFIVDALTKLSKVKMPEVEGKGFSSTERQVASILKLFLSSLDEPRVLKVKLADRLHNMKTLQYLSPQKRARIAEETLTIYVPVAHMMGMGRVKGELEDLSFKYIYPKEYSRLDKLLSLKRKIFEKKLLTMETMVSKLLKREKIPFRIEYRVKRLYSIYNKMRKKGLSLEGIDDLLALRVITDSVDKCYQILGLVHQEWTPIQSRLRDWIASPKPNGYRSLHTTVIAGKDKFEIQIRTEEMHREAEFGSASHLAYKKDKSYIKEALDFVRELKEENPEGGKKLIKRMGESLEIKEVVYVQTPKGHTIELPVGSTPLDFAYAVHTEVGHRAAGAKVNGRKYSLRKPLQSGQVVEIITDPRANPSVDWLNYVKTQRARQKIKSWFKKTEKSEVVPIGKKIWEEFLKKNSKLIGEIGEEELERRLKNINISDVDYFYYLLGKESIAPTWKLLKKIFPDRMREEKKKKEREISRPGVVVEGIENIEVEFAKCCNPIKGEEIIAYVTNRGIKIHSKNCPLYLQGLLNPSKIKEAQWAKGPEKQTLPLRLKVIDRPGILKEILELISKFHVNVANVGAESLGDGTASVNITLEIDDSKQWKGISSIFNSQEEILEFRIV